jgi:hypothetical protein
VQALNIKRERGELYSEEKTSTYHLVRRARVKGYLRRLYLVNCVDFVYIICDLAILGYGWV